jgi:uncharacterized RDD family membrane protein YckC
MSAAQNRLLLKACRHCGAANSENAEACSVCAGLLGHSEQALGPVSVPSSQPEWRLEVAHRLEAYRARRQRNQGAADGPQAEMPFLAGGRAPKETSAVHAQHARKPERRRVGIEIAVIQPELDFSVAEGCRIDPAALLVPVASLSERLYAGLCDAAFLVLAFGGFLVLFTSLGGRFSFGKLDAAVYAAAFFLLFAQYFALFTVFGGATPGMCLCRLRVVRFDGGDPGPAQLLLRSFGYLVSAGTLFLGFLWSLWDEDHLTWQDRISQTYNTHASA